MDFFDSQMDLDENVDSIVDSYFSFIHDDDPCDDIILEDENTTDEVPKYHTEQSENTINVESILDEQFSFLKDVCKDVENFEYENSNTIESDFDSMNTLGNSDLTDNYEENYENIDVDLQEEPIYSNVKFKTDVEQNKQVSTTFIPLASSDFNDCGNGISVNFNLGGISKSPNDGISKTSHDGISKTSYDGISKTYHGGVSKTPHDGISKTSHDGISKTSHDGISEMPIDVEIAPLDGITKASSDSIPKSSADGISKTPIDSILKTQIDGITKTSVEGFVHPSLDGISNQNGVSKIPLEDHSNKISSSPDYSVKISVSDNSKSLSQLHYNLENNCNPEPTIVFCSNTKNSQNKLHDSLEDLGCEILDVDLTPNSPVNVKSESDFSKSSIGNMLNNDEIKKQLNKTFQNELRDDVAKHKPVPSDKIAVGSIERSFENSKSSDCDITDINSSGPSISTEENPEKCNGTAQNEFSVSYGTESEWEKLRNLDLEMELLECVDLPVMPRFSKEYHDVEHHSSCLNSKESHEVPHANFNKDSPCYQDLSVTPRSSKEYHDGEPHSSCFKFKEPHADFNKETTHYQDLPASPSSSKECHDDEQRSSGFKSKDSHEVPEGNFNKESFCYHDLQLTPSSSKETHENKPHTSCFNPKESQQSHDSYKTESHLEPSSSYSKPKDSHGSISNSLQEIEMPMEVEDVHNSISNFIPNEHLVPKLCLSEEGIEDVDYGRQVPLGAPSEEVLTHTIEIFEPPSQENSFYDIQDLSNNEDFQSPSTSYIRPDSKNSLSGVIRRSMRKMKHMRISGRKSKRKSHLSEETGIRRNLPDNPEIGLPSVRSPTSSAVLLPSLMAVLAPMDTPRETLPSPPEIIEAPQGLANSLSQSLASEASRPVNQSDPVYYDSLNRNHQSLSPSNSRVNLLDNSGPSLSTRHTQIIPTSTNQTSPRRVCTTSSVQSSNPVSPPYVIPDRDSRIQRERDVPEYCQHHLNYPYPYTTGRRPSHGQRRRSRPRSIDVSSNISHSSNDFSPVSPSGDPLTINQGRRSSATPISRSQTESDIYGNSSISDVGGQDRIDLSYWELPRSREDNSDDAPQAKRSLWPHSHSGSMVMLAVTLNMFNISRFAVLGAQFGWEFFAQWLIISSLIGLPLMSFLVSAGQAVGRSCIDFWTISPIFKGVGYSLLLVEVTLAIYCCVPVAWLFTFFRDSFDMRRFRCYLPSSCDAPQNLTNEINNYVTGYLSMNVLQRYDESSSILNNLGSIKFDLSFNIALIWVITFLALSRGPRSYGKVCYLIIGLSLVCFFSVGIYLVYWTKPPIRLIPSATFFVNRHSWLAASREAFLVWCLHGAVFIQTGSNNKKRHRLWKDVFFVTLVTVVGLGIATVCGLVVSHSLRQKGLYYGHSSFETESSSAFVKVRSSGRHFASSEEQDGPDYTSEFFKPTPFFDNFYAGIRIRDQFESISMYRSSSAKVDTSGYNAIRFITEMFPALIFAEDQEIVPVWPPLFYLGLLFSGLAYQLAVWYSVVQGFIHINYRLLYPWETFICFCSCLFAFSASLLMASPIGIHVLYFLDYNIGCAWWIMILHLIMVLGIVLVRGKPYTAQQIAKRLFGPGKCCSSAWATAPVAFSWSIMAPVGLLVLSISSFKTGNFQEVFTWNYIYWSATACQLASGTQLFFLLLVPSVAVIQTFRYFVNPKWDIFERVQNLYRPRIFAGSETDGTRSPDVTDADLGLRPGDALQHPNQDSEEADGQRRTDQRGHTEDPPPKYTPPPSYSTATGFGFTKNFNQSFRRLRDTFRQRRIEDDCQSQSPTRGPPEPYIPPPDYSRSPQRYFFFDRIEQDTIHTGIRLPKVSPSSGGNPTTSLRSRGSGETSQEQSRKRSCSLGLSRSFCKPTEPRGSRLRRTLTSSFRRHGRRLVRGSDSGVNSNPRASGTCFCDALAISSISLENNPTSSRSYLITDETKQSEA